MTPPDWTRRYIGLPYRPLGRDLAGCDCWGLVTLVYARELNIVLPDHCADYRDPEARAEVARLIETGRQAPEWRPLPESHPAQDFDVALFRVGRLVSHVGLVCGGGGFVLHIAAGDCAKIESLKRGSLSLRLKGLYRHISRT